MNAQTYRGVDGKEYRELIRPVRIVITRAEGFEHECKPVEAANWTQAYHALLSASNSAPKDGKTYDKTDFKVTFEDGLEYDGRYELKHWSVESPNLALHIRKFVEWMAHSPKAVEMQVKPEHIAAAKQMLVRYDLQQAPVPA